MPGRRLLFDLRCRNENICRSCLLSTRQSPRTPQTRTWVATYSSQAGRQRPRRRTQTQPRQPSARAPLQGDLLKQLEQFQPSKEGARPGTDYTVSYYEQDGDKRTKLDDASFEQSLSGLDATTLTESLVDMKGVMRTKQEREAFDEVMSEMGGGLDGMRTIGDIENMLSRADNYTAKLDREILDTMSQLPKSMQDSLYADLGEFMPRPDDRKSTSQVPQISEGNRKSRQLKKIAVFNNVVRRVWTASRGSKGLAEKHIQALYRGYFAVRPTLSDDWSCVPLDLWDFLWKVFSTRGAINKNRLAHIYLLARDMGEAKVPLSPKQQLLTIEAVFIGGWEDKAMENWKRCVVTLGGENLETFHDFWELGLRMHCRMGDLDQAERAATLLLDKHADARILLPIIRARCERGSPGDHEAAWLSYRRMRDLLGQRIKLQDYDQAISCFLATHQIENAFYAFVDMMSEGQVDLKMLPTMPSVVANKFFIGKWLKRLIGAGDFDGAYSVVEYMRNRGVSVAAIHLNGLIGAWQRSGGAENMEKADKLAWEMIQTRIDFVRARRQPPRAKTKAVSPRTSAAPLPRATLETFCVLADNYRMRGLNDRMTDLWSASREAEISPDAFMMNQLLESYIQSGEHKEAMALYKALVADRGVKPDPQTFSALWKTLSINRLHYVEPSALESAAEAARRMFAETARFRDVFQENGMDIQLCRKILHTFRRLKDNAGFLVALTSLKELFGFLPTEILVMEMVIGTTNLSWETAQQRRQMVQAKRNLDRELEEWAGRDTSKIEGEKRGVALYEYLQRKYWPQMDDGEGVEKALLAVAKQMGVEEVLVPSKK